MLQASLWVADLVLLGLAALFVFRAEAGLGFLEILLCASAIILGAWLACLALLLE